ncbi:hypothetical protein ACFFHM_00500 [Halalkalibacter kiskunsagensis]|uniref:DUF11 domain-containing protein n=1 Tax=Halalkalibacter kiskunsagensis TaxID=1548599 RepID=A0ABV6K705_9BACI
MKKILFLCLFVTSIIILSGYDKDDIILTDIETTIIKAENTLRYDIKLKNVGDTEIRSVFDYPGHHPMGFEIVIRPNKELESLMKMEEQSKYKKMVFRGGGSSGLFEVGKEATFHIEYEIKNTSDLNKVSENAFDGTLREYKLFCVNGNCS